MSSITSSPSTPLLDEINNETQLATFEEQLRCVIICIAGQEVTTEREQLKQPSVALHRNIIAYIQGDRFNVDFAQLIQKRKIAFRPYFILTQIDKSMKESLLKYFFVDKNIDSEYFTKVNTFWKLFQETKTTFRNKWNLCYEKVDLVEHSGNYDDSQALDSTMEKAVMERIEYNFKQWTYNAMKKFKTANPNASEEDIQEHSNLKYKEKKPVYDLQMKDWKKNVKILPPEWLAFVLLGPPGKKYPTLVVSFVTDNNELVNVPKDKAGRKNMREANNLATNSKHGTASSSDNDGNNNDRRQVIDLTKSEAIGREMVELKRRKLEMADSKRQEDSLQKLLKMYDPVKDKHKLENVNSTLILFYEQFAFQNQQQKVVSNNTNNCEVLSTAGNNNFTSSSIEASGIAFDDANETNYSQAFQNTTPISFHPAHSIDRTNNTPNFLDNINNNFVDLDPTQPLIQSNTSFNRSNITTHELAPPTTHKKGQQQLSVSNTSTYHEILRVGSSSSSSHSISNASNKRQSKLPSKYQNNN